MNLKVKRIYKGEYYTIGKLYINGQYFCDTIEDKDRKLDNNMPEHLIESMKVYGQTAIPTGTYIIDMNTESPKFKNRSWAKPYGGKLPRLIGVKGFEGILIHVGNTQHDSLGCILVGYNKIKGNVLNSTACFQQLMPILLKAHLTGEVITITVE